MLFDGNSNRLCTIGHGLASPRDDDDYLQLCRCEILTCQVVKLQLLVGVGLDLDTDASITFHDCWSLSSTAHSRSAS